MPMVFAPIFSLDRPFGFSTQQGPFALIFAQAALSGFQPSKFFYYFFQMLYLQSLSMLIGQSIFSSSTHSYDCVWMYLILLYHYSSYNDLLMLSSKISHTTGILFTTLDTIVQVQCDLAITRNTCGSICFLNCLNLFLKIKLVRLVQCIFNLGMLYMQS